MKTNDFQPALTSSQLQENIFRQFGTKIALEKYDRERLENVRNLLRTKVDQTEKSAGVNDLLTNETYQKDKAMLQLLNTRIKEMLGEDIKTLRDKLDAINEGKKSMKDPIRTTKSKGPMADKDYDGDGKVETNKDEVWGSRAKAAAKSGKPFKEGSGEAEIDADLRSRGGDQDTKSKFNKQETKPGVTRYTKKSSTFNDDPHKKTPKPAHTKADTQAKKDDEAKSQDYDAGPRRIRKDGETHYYIGKKKCSKDDYDAAMGKIDKRASQAKRLAAMGEDASGKTCNKTPKGKRCPVHGLQECGMVYESIDSDEAGFYVVDNDGNPVAGPFDSKQEAYEEAMQMAPGRNRGMYDVKYKGDVIPLHSLIRKICQALPPDVASDDIMDPLDLQHHLKRNPLGQVFVRLSPKEKAHVTDEVANYFYEKNGMNSAFGDLDEGKDEGKPGKGFAKIVKKATPKYGKETAEKIAGAQKQKMKKAGKLEEAHRIFKRHVKIVNESLAYLLSENEEDKAKAITAAGDIVNDYTSWMQRVGQYQTKSMIELSDSIRGDFGVQQAEAFKNAVAPALAATLEVLTAQREAISNAVAVLAGEQIPETPMGAEPGMEPGMDMAGPDMMNEPAGDEFGAADAAAGAGTPGREMRESAAQRRARKLAESHSIMSKLAR